MKPYSINDKCTESDCRKIFASSIEELGWLCYTLTGDQKLSDKALQAAMEQSVKGAGQVFREWMLSWTRRLIIKFCITTMRPTVAVTDRHYYISQRFAPIDTEHVELALSLSPDVLQRKLQRLDTLHRFAFVLRAMEGYSRRDTALLLGVDDRTCEWSYAQAVAAIQPNIYVMKSNETRMELVSA